MSEEDTGFAMVKREVKPPVPEGQTEAAEQQSELEKREYEAFEAVRAYLDALRANYGQQAADLHETPALAKKVATFELSTVAGPEGVQYLQTQLDQLIPDGMVVFEQGQEVDITAEMDPRTGAEIGDENVIIMVEDAFGNWVPEGEDVQGHMVPAEGLEQTALVTLQNGEAALVKVDIPNPGAEGTEEEPDQAALEGTEAQPELDAGGGGADVGGPDEPVEPGAEAGLGYMGRLKKNASEFFRKHMKGEYIESPEDESRAARGVRLLASGVGSGVASLIGVKVFADLPRYMGQKYYKRGEQNKMIDAWKASPERAAEAGPQVALEARKAALEAKIDGSSHLSPEEKAQMKAKLTETLARFNDDVTGADEVRNQAVADLVRDSVDSRIKGSTVIKEAGNTALLATGLATVRGSWYGAVALGERAARIKKERKERSESGEELADGFMNEWIMKGVKETLQGLTLQGEGDKFQKGLKFMESTAAVTRLVGFSGLALNELGGGEIGEKIAELTRAMDEGSVAEFARDNVAESTFGKILEMAGVDVAGDGGAVEAAADLGESMQETVAEQAAREAREALSSQIDVGTVHRGDGIIKILTRQFEAQADDFGFAGGTDAEKSAWAARQALDLAREEGFVAAGVDVRLSTESIDHLAIAIEHGADGPSVAFLDTASGRVLESADAANAAGYFDGYPDSALEEAAAAATEHATAGTEELSDAVEAAEAGEIITGMEVRRLGNVSFEHDGADVTGWNYTGDSGYPGVFDVKEAGRLVRGSIDKLPDEDQANLRRFYVAARAVRQMERDGMGDSAEADYLKTQAVTLYRQLNRVGEDEILKPRNAIVKSARTWRNQMWLEALRT